MKTAVELSEFLERIAAVSQLCPEMRFGQLVATIALLAEDETGRNIWDVEDGEFAAAVERFAADLLRRNGTSAEEINRLACLRSQSATLGQ